MRAINKHSTKPFSREVKRVALSCGGSRFLLPPLGSSSRCRRSLWRILSYAKSNPDATVARKKRDPGSGTSNLKVTPALVEAIRKLLTKSPTLSLFCL
jgi:hypothetical protein